ncbi:hypothetical protein BV898_11153 [Hypsibius exemplaris]|uniref:Proteasome assembly chaperone 4 n=1 Tax=Hypsibius exemplaris TaxID=2072580 RepID=A0A1W0WHI5_HYPEX|nr:hypothetical protein BV898_11153 [Hypsibius exemplaris]
MAATSAEFSLEKDTTNNLAPSTAMFQATLQGLTVYFQLIRLRNSCFLWIGDSARRVDALSVALPNPFDNKAPLVTAITDRRTNDAQPVRDEGQQIAAKLSRKLGAQVFVTYNVAEASEESDLLTAIEAHLFSLIKNGVAFTL